MDLWRAGSGERGPGGYRTLTAGVLGWSECIVDGWGCRYGISMYSGLGWSEQSNRSEEITHETGRRSTVKFRTIHCSQVSKSSNIAIIFYFHARLSSLFIPLCSWASEACPCVPQQHRLVLDSLYAHVRPLLPTPSRPRLPDHLS